MLSRWARFLTGMLMIVVGGIALAHDVRDHESPGIERFWTHVTGKFRVEGSFVALKAGQVQILKHDGEILEIKLEALSREDRQWVQNRTDAIARFNGGPRLIMASQRRQATAAPEMSKAFAPFADKLKTRWDDTYFYVESNGIPDHQMMVGITSWQQQVPIPQAYTGQNAWQIPLHPVVAKNPISARNHFLRGAIALATNGIPIFNPLNNRGDDAFLFGELDDFGGHCGRADDYHYHLAPVHLEKTLGKGLPLAYALDGYAVYGYDEPDGAKVAKLDGFNGHADDQNGYHYHATKTYPYLNGGFHGEVKEVGGQVDPQPRAQSPRPALTPLRGAKITGFTWAKNGKHSLIYEVNGRQGFVYYSIAPDGSLTFDFISPAGKTSTETYQLRGQGGGRGPQAKGQARGGNRPPRPEDGPGGPPEGGRRPKPPLSAALDKNGDGELSKVEIAASATSIKTLDRNKDGKVTDTELRPPRPGDDGREPPPPPGDSPDDRPPPPRDGRRPPPQPELNAIDLNHDGVLSPDEIAVSPKSLLKLDRDNNGILTDDELRPEPPPGEGPPPRTEAPEPRQGGRPPRGGQAGDGDAAAVAAAASKDDFGPLLLMSPAFKSGGKLPAEFTCDGGSASPPIEWDKAPKGTKSFALSVWHVPPGSGIKSYWLLYNIPASVDSVPKNAKRVGTVGLNDKRQASYDPMCSKGPGLKTYHITVYALSKELDLPARSATRAELLKAMGDAKLAQKTISFTYERAGQE